MVVRSAYEQQGQPSSICCHQFAEEFNIFHFMEQWVERGIVTGDLAVIPETVHFSRHFSINNKNGDIRPILDLSFLNSFI